MARRFIVEVKIFPLMTDLIQPFAAGQPVGGLHGCLQINSGVIDRFKRLSAEAVQQIHQQQLLMLLFVLKAQLASWIQLSCG